MANELWGDEIQVVYGPLHWLKTGYNPNVAYIINYFLMSSKYIKLLVVWTELSAIPVIMWNLKIINIISKIYLNRINFHF